MGHSYFPSYPFRLAVHNLPFISLTAIDTAPLVKNELTVMEIKSMAQCFVSDCELYVIVKKFDPNLTD